MRKVANLKLFTQFKLRCDQLIYHLFSQVVNRVNFSTREPFISIYPYHPSLISKLQMD